MGSRFNNYIFIIMLLFFMGCKRMDKPESAVSIKVNLEEIEEADWFFWSVDYHPKLDRFVVGGSNNSTLKIIDASSYKEIYNANYIGTITKTKWHPTANKIAIAMQDENAKLSILDTNNYTVTYLDSITSDGARAIGWNNTGSILAVGDNNGFLSFFTQDGTFLRNVNTGQRGLMSLDWHPVENIVVTVGERISIYDYNLDSIQHVEDRKDDVLMLCVTWHPDGSLFTTGDYGDYVKRCPPLLQYWNESGNSMRSIIASTAEYRNMSWSNDGKVLATASDKIRLWDKTGELIKQNNYDNLLWGIDWNIINNKLITTDNKTAIQIWDRDLNLIKQIKY